MRITSRFPASRLKRLKRARERFRPGDLNWCSSAKLCLMASSRLWLLLLVPALLGAVLAILFLHLYSPLEPQLWTDPFPLGNLPVVNRRLTNATKASLGILQGPESLAASSSGAVFASLADGRIVLLDQKGMLRHVIYFNGSIHTPSGFIYEDKSVYEGAKLNLQWCIDRSRANELAYDVANERACGRPLGLRYLHSGSKGRLYFADAYTGIYRIDLSSADEPLKITHLVSTSTPIHHQQQQVDEHSLLTPKFFNDLDITEDEHDIYFTDTSYKNHRSQNRQEVLDGAPRGRLFHFNVQKKSLEVLLCGLHFPNGVQLRPGSKSKELLVVESARFRILRVKLDKLKGSELLTSCAEEGSLRQHLKSSDPKAVELFMDEAPGFMDNIRLHVDNKQVTYLVGVGAKSSKPFSLLHLAYRSITLRQVIGRLIPMKNIENLIPKYGLVLVVDDQGRLVDSYQDPTGGVSMVSEAMVHPSSGDLWLGSHSNPFIGIAAKANLK